jgi:hypothetical protein
MLHTQHDNTVTRIDQPLCCDVARQVLSCRSNQTACPAAASMLSLAGNAHTQLLAAAHPAFQLGTRSNSRVTVAMACTKNDIAA